MWGDVIRNFTMQERRRVDLTFAVGYHDDVTKVERLLKEIVTAEPRVLREPEPTIRLNELAESSMRFVVQVWTLQANYMDVCWDLTRAVRLRFDAEGIQVPVPQRELHVNMVPGLEKSELR